MKEMKKQDQAKNTDEEIRSYIKKKKEENSALKKLLNALENAKKNENLNSFL